MFFFLLRDQPILQLNRLKINILSVSSTSSYRRVGFKEGFLSISFFPHHFLLKETQTKLDPYPHTLAIINQSPQQFLFIIKLKVIFFLYKTANRQREQTNYKRVNEEKTSILQNPKSKPFFLCAKFVCKICPFFKIYFWPDTQMGGISGFLTNFPPFIYFLLSLLERIPVKLPISIEKMVSRVSHPRTGRHLQRYDNRGFRLVVG